MAEENVAATELSNVPAEGENCVECHESGICAQTEGTAEPAAEGGEGPTCTECGEPCDECECVFDLACGCGRPTILQPGFYLVSGFCEVLREDMEDCHGEARRFASRHEAQAVREQLLREHDEQWVTMENPFPDFQWGWN